MSEPVVERIMQAVRSRVAATRTAYRSANVAKWQPKDNVLHVHQGDIVENPELNCPGNPPAKGWTVVAAVAAILKPSDTDTTPIDTYKNRAWAVIVQAVTDADLWHQWGGLALNTVHGPVEEYTEETGGLAGVMVRFTITFRVDEGDPYTVRA